jgi:proline iminopeptidase
LYFDYRYLYIQEVIKILKSIALKEKKVRLKLVILFLIMVFIGMTVLSQIPGPGQEKNNNMSVQENKIASGEVTLHVRTAGELSSGNVLIAINGGPGQSSRYMRSLEKLAGPELAIVTYDQRGTGLSTEPTEGYGLPEYIADIDAIRKALGAEKIHIFGHSWGGVLAMRYCSVYPDRIKSLILMGSGPPSRQLTLAGQARLGERLAELQEQGIIPQPLPSNVKQLLDSILPAYFSDPSFKISELTETAFNETANQKTLTAVGDWNFIEEVKNITHPVLMLWGENDPFGLPMAQATRDALSKASIKFIILKGCGHYWQECPDEFFSCVLEFLNQ